jgi:hypothetical protein
VGTVRPFVIDKGGVLTVSDRYRGGWLAPNIYFLGFSGCVKVNGVRIAGSSGIYNSNHYNFGPFLAQTSFSHSLDVIFQ